jgi:hypothetical protein
MTDDDFAELFKRLPGRNSGGSSWRDVGAELEALGRTFGDMLRAAWQESENDPVMRQMRSSVEDAIDRLGRSAEDNAETREAREQLVRLAEAIRSAAERAGDELRPELLALLRRANSELRRYANLDDNAG